MFFFLFSPSCSFFLAQSQKLSRMWIFLYVVKFRAVRVSVFLVRRRKLNRLIWTSVEVNSNFISATFELIQRFWRALNPSIRFYEEVYFWTGRDGFVKISCATVVTTCGNKWQIEHQIRSPYETKRNAEFELNFALQSTLLVLHLLTFASNVGLKKLLLSCSHQ